MPVESCTRMLGSTELVGELSEACECEALTELDVEHEIQSDPS